MPTVDTDLPTRFATVRNLKTDRVSVVDARTADDLVRSGRYVRVKD